MSIESNQRPLNVTLVKHKTSLLDEKYYLIDMNPEIRTRISGVFIMSKLSKKDKYDGRLLWHLKQRNVLWL